MVVPGTDSLSAVSTARRDVGAGKVSSRRFRRTASHGDRLEANDSRLDRLVAAKILPASMAVSSDARQRFD